MDGPGPRGYAPGGAERGRAMGRDDAEGLDYAGAGVDVAAGEALVERIAPAARRTDRPGTMGAIGGFGGLFDLRAAGYADPILVATTDGVGTKLRIAIDTGRLGGLGQDLVAMCVNDLVCQGAEPLFFLDYLAAGRLDVDAAAEVVEGIAAACAAAGCALIGGETAEMPGMYAPGDMDLAGFAVGAVERGAVLPAGAGAGDVLIGLPSDGVHANGFSLVRRVAARAGLGWDDAAPFADGPLGAALLAPTRLYVRPALAAIRAGGVRALAHVTGGGITGPLPRVLPEGCGARVELGAWTAPPVFSWLAAAGGVEQREMLGTFNCGIGMILVVAPDRAEAALALLGGEGAVRIGEVVTGEGVRYDGALGG